VRVGRAPVAQSRKTGLLCCGWLGKACVDVEGGLGGLKRLRVSRRDAVVTIVGMGLDTTQ